MKNIKLLLALLISLCSLSPFLIAQDYPITNGAMTSVCSGNFYDTGGATGDYSSNENIVHTFCPDVPGDCLWFDFSEYNSEFNPIPIIGGPVDYLNIYDGNSTAAPLLQTFSSDFGDFTIPTASSNGCITFEFISNGNTQFSGWAATIDCVPCPVPQNSSQQNCIGGIPVCESTYFQPNSYSGIGNPINEINDGFSCLDDGEQNGVWYSFSVDQSGDLSFLIYPLSNSDDYDWTLFDLTTAECWDIFPNNGLAPEISCNYSNSSNGVGGLINNGITGASSAAPYNGVGNSALNSGSPYNANIPVTAGSNYVLYISNFSATQSGYFLDFSESTAVIFDDSGPEIISMDPVSCFDLDVFVNLNEPILCSSIDQFDVEIIGPGGAQNNVAIADGVGCTSPDDFTEQVRLRIWPRIITSGTYTVTLNGEYIDKCGNVGTGSSFSFYTEIVDVDAGNNITFCQGDNAPVALGGSPTSAELTPSYTWTANPASALAFLSSTTTANPTFNNPGSVLAGTYEYIVEVDNGNCTGPDTLTVNVQNCGCNIGAVATGSTLLCNGDMNGTVSLNVTGGTMPFTYNWSGPGGPYSTSSLNNIGAGSYFVTVTDFSGCEATSTTNVTEPSVLTTGSSIIDAGCGVCDGSIDLTVAGGTGSLTYLWEDAGNPGVSIATTQDISMLCDGTYCVTVSDASGCSTSSCIIINQSGGPSIDNISAQAENCGQTDGFATAVVSGGTGPYNFAWENTSNPGTILSTTNPATGLGTGNYSLTVSNANGTCAVTSGISIGALGGPIISGVTTTPSVCGGNTGTATANVSGGAAPYTFNWENTANPGVPISISNPATGLADGTYSITVTDASGCPSVSGFNITSSGGLSVSVLPSSNMTTCNGNTDVNIDLTVTGGNAPFTYSWIGPGGPYSTEDLMSVGAGNYAVTVSDALGCIGMTSVGIVDPPVLIVAGMPTPPTCSGGSDGSISAFVFGGLGGYDFIWDNGETTQDISGLIAGTYTISVTDGAGCTMVTPVTLNSPPLFEATATGEQITCAGTNDGDVSLIISNGAAPYTYSWDNGETTQDISGLIAGTYIVTVTDSNGCEVTSTANITEPSQLGFNTVTATNVLCTGDSNGSIFVTPSGGDLPYSYEWDNGSTDFNITGLSSGIYVLTVTDDSNCTITNSITLTEPIGITASATNVQDDFCNNDSGVATVTATGGTIATDYSYFWGPPIIPPQTTATATGLEAGTYTVVVTDDNGCTGTSPVTINSSSVTIDPNETIVNVACFGSTGGEIILNPTGGLAPYTYQWSAGWGTNNSISNAPAGTYIVTIYDQNGCTITESFIVSDPPPPLLIFVDNVDQVSCVGSTDGAIDISGGGGIPPYTFAWDHDASITSTSVTGLAAGDYMVSITGGNGCYIEETITVPVPVPVSVTINEISGISCNGESDGVASVTAIGGQGPYTYFWPTSGETIGTAFNLPPGANPIMVTDANGCTGSGSISFTDPSALIVTTQSTNAPCGGNEGTVLANGSGGTQPYTYDWGALGTGQTIANVPLGTYTVFVTDANGCIETGSATVVGPDPVTPTISQTQPVTCFGDLDGLAYVTVSGGQVPYTYQWDNGEISNPAIFLTAGDHQLTVTDNAGCFAVITTTIGGPDLMLPGIVVNPVSCNGGFDGSATVNMSGGTPPYYYEWNSTPPQYFAIATGLSAGVYILNVTDENNCAMSPVNVTVPEPLIPVSVDITGMDPICYDGNEGFVTANPQGGTPGYSYLWNTGANWQTLVNVGFGNYSVTVTDTYGCQAVANYSLNNPLPVQVQVQATGVTCFGDANGMIAITTVNGGAGAPYSFSLDGENFQLDTLFGGLFPGTYTVYANDIDGCVVSQTIEVEEPEEIIVNAGEDVTIQLGEEYQIMTSVMPDIDSLVYSWESSTDDTLSCSNCPNPSLMPAESVTLQVLATDTLGCLGMDEILITVDKDRNIFIPNAFSPNNDGTNDLFMIYGGLGVMEIKSFVIFDRWGERMFEASGFQPNMTEYGWNGMLRGKKLNPSVFVYFAEVEYLDGKTIEYKGDVTLLR